MLCETRSIIIQVFNGDNNHRRITETSKIHSYNSEHPFCENFIVKGPEKDNVTCTVVKFEWKGYVLFHVATCLEFSTTRFRSHDFRRIEGTNKVITHSVSSI